jgi:predicted nuclease of predicted toxin-antitoxin system
VSIRFYLDEHINPAITEGLRRRGVDVLTVQADDRLGAADAEILSRAAELGRVVVTSDTDYIALVRRAANARARPTGVVFIAQGSMSIGAAIEDLQIIAGATTIDEWANRLEHLPL